MALDGWGSLHIIGASGTWEMHNKSIAIYGELKIYSKKFILAVSYIRTLVPHNLVYFC